MLLLFLLFPFFPVCLGKIAGNLFIKKVKIIFYNIFHLALLYLIIIVYQYMAHLLNHTPRCVGVSILKHGCQFIGCFAYDFYALDNAIIFNGVL